MIPAELTDSSWQLASTKLPRKLWDVAVVGSGPAGASAACRLAQMGHSVVLLEKHRFPRDKVCGDGLLPVAVEQLGRLGLRRSLEQYAHPLSAIRIYSPGQVWFDVAGNFLSIRRRILDTLIARHASQSGAVTAQATVSHIAPTRHHVELTVDGADPLTARQVIIATGAEETLARAAGLAAPHPPTALAMRCYLQSTLDLPYAVLSYDNTIRPGYAWLFPLGNGLYNVGCGTLLSCAVHPAAQLREAFDAFITTFPLARELMSTGSLLNKLHGAVIRAGLPLDHAMVNGRACAIGETIGTTLPFTGEGISTAITSALAAAESIDQVLRGKSDSLEAYHKSMTTMSRSLFGGYATAQRWLSQPAINDFVARRIQRSPYLRQTCSGIILGTVNPREVYSLRGITRSLFG